MTYKQYIGAKGEAEMLQLLLRTGAAVNGLTASDTGWDLHLHVPSMPQDLADVDPAIAGKLQWQLSGRTAHVQVKRTSKKGGLPKLDIGTARGWVTGSRAGTPTFLVYGEPHDDGTVQWSFATPSAIERWLWERRDRVGGKSNVATMVRHDIEPEWFGWVLHLWAHYAPLLLQASELDDLMWSRKTYPVDELEGLAVDLTARLVSGFLADIRATQGSDDSWWLDTGARQLAIAALNALIGGFNEDGETSYWSPTLLQGVSDRLLEACLSGPGDWAGTGLPTGLYDPVVGGQPQDPERALATLARDVHNARSAVLSYIGFRFTPGPRWLSGLPTGPE